MKRIKIIGLLLGILVVPAIIFASVANAQSFKTGNTVTVASGETVDSMLFAGGMSVDIAGTVNGDVYCAGQTINISGDVKGDVFCAGQTITISGKVEGGVRLAGQTITISGTIASSATIGAQSLTIDKTGMINRDLLGGSQNITINGQIGRDVAAGSGDLTVNGSIGRDITGRTDSINVGSAGMIVGNVNYTGKNDPNITSGGKILGTVKRTQPAASNTNMISSTMFIFGTFFYIFIVLVIFALIVALMFPRILDETASNTMKSPGRTALVGAIAMLLAPVAIVLLMISVIGIPLAIFLLLVWLIIMMLSGPFASYLFGRLMMKKSKKTVLIMLLGAIILTLVAMIPILGFIVTIVIEIFGTGMLLMRSTHLFKRVQAK